MKQTGKKLITLSTGIVLFLSCFVFTAYAADSTIAFSNNSPKVNDTITVTVTVNGGEPMYATEFDVNYNPDVLQFVSGDAANTAGAGIVHVVGTPGGKSRDSYSIQFKAIASGASSIQVKNSMYATDVEKSFTGASATLTVSDASKSSNANLSALSLSSGRLSPSFSASRTSYTATVSNSVTECRVYATAADSGASVSVSGSNTLSVGRNTRTVTVTAPSGAQKTYTITITRLEEGAESSDTDTSSDTESAGETGENPYEATVDGAAYTVATDISGITLPTGFSASTAEYNGAEVAVAEDSGRNLTVYYLKAADSEEYVPYLLNADSGDFERLKYAVFGDKTYIFADIPEGYTVPDGYYETDVKIGEFDLRAYADSGEETPEFYYLYCFFDDGFRTYRYDSRENVLQRCPEFQLVPENGEALSENAGLIERFNSLSSNAKVIVIGLLLAAAGAVALIVILIVKLVNSKNTLPGDDDDDLDLMFSNSFDSVNVSDGSASEPEDDAIVDLPSDSGRHKGENGENRKEPPEEDDNLN